LRHFGSTGATAAICALLTAVTMAAAGCSSAPDRAHPTAAGSPAAGARPSYYLSLGDSLAQGVQPDAAGRSLPTDDGYPDRVYAALRRTQPGLRLVKLGCSGETSFTMIHGGTCHYRGGSQLAAATRFLRAHRSETSLVTIDIGANDPNSCFLGAPLLKIGSCMSSRVRLTVGDLATILSRLRAAGGPRVRIIGMNYYVPELAGWLHGKIGQEVAVLTERLVRGYNSLLTSQYQHYHARVANVFDAFHSADFTDVRLAPYGTVPRNVATVCQLTWACSRPPQQPNEHANTLGYRTIARAFLLADQQ
jgi:lysophospholipase L1-like esterase